MKDRGRTPSTPSTALRSSTSSSSPLSSSRLSSSPITCRTRRFPLVDCERARSLPLHHMRILTESQEASPAEEAQPISQPPCPLPLLDPSALHEIAAEHAVLGRRVRRCRRSAPHRSQREHQNAAMGDGCEEASSGLPQGESGAGNEASRPVGPRTKLTPSRYFSNCGRRRATVSG